MKKTGVICLLWTVGVGELCLLGDPSDEVPLFLLPLRLRRRVRLPNVGPVEAKAQYCRELLERGLIEPMTAGAESGDRRFQISGKGCAVVMRLRRWLLSSLTTPPKAVR